MGDEARRTATRILLGGSQLPAKVGSGKVAKLYTSVNRDRRRDTSTPVISSSSARRGSADFRSLQ